MSSKWDLVEADRAVLAGWLKPSTPEVLAMRSRIVEVLSSRATSPAELRTALDADASLRIDVGAFPAERALVGDVLTETHPWVIAARQRGAFDEALYQLRSDRVVEDEPTPQEVTIEGRRHHGSSAHGFRETIRKRPPQNSAAPLRLVSGARSWSASDHHAFDPAAYELPPRDGLLTPDGRILIAEAIGAHRAGRHLSATVVLFVFAETAWWEAARRLAPSSSTIARLASDPKTAISKIQKAVLDHLDASNERHRAASLRSWSDVSRQIRNFGAHGSIAAATSGPFTEAACAAWIISCFQHLAELEMALLGVGA